MKQAMLFLSCVLVFWCAGVQGVTRCLKAGKASGIVLDGRLDEAAWGAAETGTGFARLSERNVDKEAPREQTAFKVLQDAEAIYIGVRCGESKMGELCVNVKEYDTNPWRDDVLEVFICPTGMPDEFYQFVMAAGGAKWSQYYAEKGNVRPDPFAPYYETRVYKDTAFWSLEARIPLGAFYMTRPKAWKTTWLFNIARDRKPKPSELTTWSPLRGSFHETENFNTLTGMPMKRGVQDICLRKAECIMKSAGNGTVTVMAELDPAAAGKYTIEIATAEALSPFIQGPVTVMRTLSGGSNAIVFENVVVLKTGKHPLSILMRTEKGETAARREYPVEARYTPLTMQFTAPAYAHCFYPGQDASRLKGVLITSSTSSNITLTVEGLPQARQPKKLQLTDGKVSFDVSLAGLKTPERFIVKASTLINGSVVEVEEVIRVLPPIKRTMTWIEAPGRLIVDGKARFGLGWYGGPGWICSRWFNELYPTIEAKMPYTFFEEVSVEPERLVKGIEAKEGTKDVRPSQEVFDKIRKRIEKNRERDFMYYYLCDEPECRGISPVYLGHLYRFIKELDPYHLVMIISRAPAKYIDACDIANPHPYTNPIRNEKGERYLKSPLTRVRDNCLEIEVLNRPDKVLMLTPQTFSYSFNNMYADFPTFGETNASVWTLVAHGGQGLTPYIWYDHASRPELSLACDFIYTSLFRLGPLIAEGTRRPLSCNKKLVDAFMIRREGDTLLGIVNISPEKQTATVTDTALASLGVMHRFREGGNTLAFKGDSMRFVLAPYQVLLLTNREMDQYLPTMADTWREIERREKARRSRGNILFGRGREIRVNSTPSNYIYQNAMEQQDKLFDGVLEVSAWQPRPIGKDLWYELAFQKFVPKFTKARIYGNRLKDMEFLIFKRGEWVKPVPKLHKSEKYMEFFDFGVSLSTVKIRMNFKFPKGKLEPNDMVCLYEIELLK